MVASSPDEAALKAELERATDEKIALIEQVQHSYFDLGQAAQDSQRTPFTGVMTRDTYTKAAHFVLLREMLPPGWFRLITEMEGPLSRVVPHVFRDVIENDDLTWIAMTFDKGVKKPEMLARIEAFRKRFAAFTWRFHDRDPSATDGMTNADYMRAFIAEEMRTKVRVDPDGVCSPYPGSNYRAKHMPQVWIASPMQNAGETNRIVGFPLIRKDLRRDLKDLSYTDEIADPDSRARVARLVYTATLRSVATFFDSIRERTSPAARAGGRGARSGPSYVNGASFNPRVLIALLNIFRVYYNWFEERPYVSAWSGRAETTPAPQGTTKARVPGTAMTVEIEKRRSSTPVKRTPAMRLGIQEERAHPKSGRLVMPSLHRVLYRPWIFYGTPIWEKFEDPDADLRRSKLQRTKTTA